MKKKYVCTVTRTETYEHDIEVEADTEEQAGVMAEEQAASIDSSEWEHQDTSYSADEIREGTLDDDEDNDEEKDE